MISSKTKRTMVSAAVLLVVMSGLVAFGVYTIGVESDRLSEQVAAIAIDRSQQTAFTKLQKLVQETEADRKLLRSYYLSSQADSIDFLNYIERLAAERGVTLETVNPSEVERENRQAYLSVGYKISGGLAEVEGFVQLLETIPYVSQLISVSLSRQSSTVWRADVMIDVAVLNYE